MTTVASEHFSARSTFFSKFNYDIDAHEGFPIEVLDCVLSILGAFKFHEAKSSHDTTVDNATKAFEKLGDIIRASIGG
jgi:hypothetical protein